MRGVKGLELISLMVFLLLAGLGKEMFLVKLGGVGVGLILLGLVYLDKREIKWPRLFLGYGLFLGFFLVSLSWSVNKMKSFEEWLLFLAAGLFWLLSFNLKREFLKYLDKGVVLLGLIFGGMFLYQYYQGEMLVLPWSLYQKYTDNHYTIGDFWSLILGGLIVKGWWLLVPLGLWLVILSRSRAATLGLVVGLYYYFNFYRLKRSRRLKSFPKLGVLLVILLLGFIFLGFGLSKTVLFSRDYYVQSIVGLRHYPLGVGMGNFEVISKDTRNQVLGFDHFSKNAHGLVFEMISSFGWLSVFFLVWLYKVVKNVYWGKKELVYRVFFVILTVNFLLFSSYLLPTMLWLWFLLLGLIL